LTDFAGRWFTSFGAMLLEGRGATLTGTYRYGTTEGRIEGAARGGVFRFRYSEPNEAGTGEFRLVRPGKFSGLYTPRGKKTATRWEGHRGWDGLWETDFGRLRLVHEERGVHGFYAGAGLATLRGQAKGGALSFRYRERNASGEGCFKLAEDLGSFTGEWRARGRRDWQQWNGLRVRPAPGVKWLVVLEAHWQRSLAEPDYSFGYMLRELFARRSQVRVRQRFFHDGESLRHWCRELAFIAEPVILMIASHGLAEGLNVHGRLIDTAQVLDSVQSAESLELLHFSSCLVGLDRDKALRGREFPVSGYTTAVDWGASALLEFTYLDLMLNRGLSPAAAAASLSTLVPYAGKRAPRGSPYRAAGFRFVAAAKSSSP
jgi:hypothetical protein